jgi:hypothetical protein
MEDKRYAAVHYTTAADVFDGGRREAVAILAGTIFLDSEGRSG